MAERQIAVATQQIIDFWLGVYQAAGRTFEQTAESARNDQTAENWNPDKAVASGSSDTININNASIDDLATFFSISQSKAARIPESRPFNSVFDLAKVDGFNVHFVRRYKDRIRLR